MRHNLGRTRRLWLTIGGPLTEERRGVIFEGGQGIIDHTKEKKRKKIR